MGTRFGLRQQGVSKTFGTTEGSFTYADLQLLEWLDAYGKGIADLSGLELCPNLLWLNIWDNNITDLTPITGLNKLQTLTLSGNPVDDLSALENKPQLESLTLDMTNVDGADISRINVTTYPNLIGLKLNGKKRDRSDAITAAQAIAVLDGYSALTMLQLSRFSDLPASLSDFSEKVIVPNSASLTQFRISNCNVISANLAGMPLGLPHLGFLDLGGNPGITDSSALVGYTTLNALNLNGSRLTNLEFLETLYNDGCFKADGASINLENLGMDLTTATGSANLEIVQKLLGYGINVSYIVGNTVDP